MKSLLLILALLLGSISYSQTDTSKNDQSQIYDEEWYASLDEPVNFITYRRKCEVTIQFRIYRGFEETYTVTLTNTKGTVVWVGELNQVDEIDISGIYQGVYILTATDCNGKSMAKEVIIG